MGVHNLDKITRKLIAAGRPSDTPAAMIQMAFWPGERTVTGTLAGIAEECRRAAIQAPATLVIGEVVRLRERIRDGRRDLDRACDSVAELAAMAAAAD